MNENGAVKITEFIEARVAEDETQASILLANTQEGYDIIDYAERMLAECTAKRAVLAKRQWIDRSSGMDEWYSGYSDANYDALKALAAIYKDHPDYKQEWSA